MAICSQAIDLGHSPTSVIARPRTASRSAWVKRCTRRRVAITDHPTSGGGVHCRRLNGAAGGASCGGRQAHPATLRRHRC